VPQLVQLLPIVGLVLIFWLLILRPAQKRQKETQRLQASLTVGEEVLLGSGLIGVLRSLDDDRAQVEVAPGTVVTVVRGAIAARTNPVEQTGPVEERPADGPRTEDG